MCERLELDLMYFINHELDLSQARQGFRTVCKHKILIKCINHCVCPGTMPVSRMRMRPWLEDMIDSNSVSGLVWVDKVRWRQFSLSKLLHAF